MKAKVNAQIIIGFTLALLMVFAVTISSYLGLRQQEEHAKWVTHTYDVKQTTESALKVIVGMESGRRGYRATSDEKFLEPYSIGLVQLPSVLTKLRTTVVDSLVKIHVNNFEININELLAFWRSLDDGIVRSGDVLSNTTVEKQKMDAVRAAATKLLDREDQLLASRSRNSEDASKKAILITLAGTVVILTVVIALMFFIMKEFRNRKKAELEAMQNYKSVLLLNDEADKKNWILEGVAKVNNRMQGAVEIKELSSVIINTILDYTQRPGGLLYLYDQDKSELKLQSTSGVTEPSIKKFSIDEGLMGKAAKNKTVTTTSDIPASSAKITSAAIDAQALSAAYIPLLLNDELKGVIEVLSWKPFTELEIEWFSIINKNMALAIYLAQAKAEAKTYLEEVQEQKELLQAQQEELRQTNEELIKQSEELQASEEELRVQEEELRQINAELEEKNEAVQVAMQNLDQKAKELEQTSQFKSEFLANMSHELRTPLNSILILAKLLQENTKQNLTSKQIEYAGIIHKSGSDLLELINDILDLSKIEAGKVEMIFEDVQVQSIAENMRQTFEVLAQQKKIHFSIVIDEALPLKINTDKQRIEQVLKNLLSNALKFTPENGSVTLSFQLNDASSNLIAITVKDTGIGIPQNKQQLIFHAFQQADGSTNRKFGGTGLGLSISRELTHLLGGKIKLKSEPGKGSEFILLLPLSTTSANTSIQKQAFDALQLVVNNPKLQMVSDDTGSNSPVERSMLIVEDDASFATILRDYASSKGYKTLVALSGKEALSIAITHLPSAIILDLKLPDIDGTTVLKQLKANPATRHIPVHVISGSSDFTAIASDSIAWLQKPVSEKDLDLAFARIQEVLQAQLRTIILYSKEPALAGAIEQLVKANKKDIKVHHFTNLEDVKKECAAIHCDCIIANLGRDVEAELDNIKDIAGSLRETNTPLIICIDKDISATVETKLKKFSETIIRTSSTSEQRLLEELDLFLFKVNENKSGDDFLKLMPTVASMAELSGKKVLVVDDDMRNVFSLTAALETHEMEVLTASDGKEAIDILKNTPGIDIVLMDIMMPEMDGYEAMKFIRKELKIMKLPIIALTAKAMSDDKKRAIEAGASDYITKPVDIQKLSSLMRVWIS